MGSLDAFVAEIRSTPPLPKFFMESPNWLEHIREPLKTLSLCCNTESAIAYAGPARNEVELQRFRDVVITERLPRL